MKKIILTTPILASLLLFGCANGNKDANGFTIPDPETFVQEVSKTASIAVKRYNKKSEVLIASDPTFIYRPTTFNPDLHPDWAVIRATNLSLDTWFEYEAESPYRATITWTYSHPDIITYKLPVSEALSRATLSFKDNAFPTEINGEKKTLLTGEITYEGAKATVSYELILKTLPEGSNE